jgi:hypothetical protein
MKLFNSQSTGKHKEIFFKRKKRESTNQLPYNPSLLISSPLLLKTGGLDLLRTAISDFKAHILRKPKINIKKKKKKRGNHLT